MIIHTPILIQNEDVSPVNSVEFTNVPTPFEGRSAASSGPRRAISGCPAPVIWTFPGLQYEGYSGRTDNTSSPQSRDFSGSVPGYSPGFTYLVIAPPCPARGPEAGSHRTAVFAPVSGSLNPGASP